MTLDGNDATGTAQGLVLGHNHRSMPLLDQVQITGFPGYGIMFDADNWNISFVDIEIDSCGTASGANKSGIYKNPAVTDMNNVTFNRCMIEGCGSDSSAAGGMNITSTALYTNRGWQFTDCIIEGNFGSDEAYFQHLRGVTFNGLHLERPAPAVTGQVAGVEFSDVTGIINGGSLAGDGDKNDYAYQFKDGSLFSVSGVNFSNWDVAACYVDDSEVYFRNNKGITYEITATGQTSGDFAPTFCAKPASQQINIADTVFTKVAFGTEEIDVTGAFASSAFTPRTIGNYHIGANVTFASSVDLKSIIISLYKNGGAIKNKHLETSGTATFTVSIDCIVPVEATSDYFEIYVRQSSGGTLNLSADSSETSFFGRLL